jgi:Ca2+-binding EF-hand superfamily protein
MKTCPDFSSRRAFLSVDNEGCGWWDLGNLKKFMKSQKCMASKQ